MSTVTMEKKTNLPTNEEKVKAENRQSLEDVRKHVLTFGNSLQGYFEHIQADVGNYKFIVEKHGEGVEIEVTFKAFVHSKTNEAIKKIPT
jgi:Mg2+ and Co2+ transporter CorA